MDSESSSGIRILIADPDTAFCVSARRALEHFGHSVTIAHDGTDLLARFSPERFEIVVAGVSLHRPNGLDILRHIKKRSPETPVFLLCDDTSTGTAQAGVNEGAFAYFSTHLEDFEELADAIEHAMDSPREADSSDLAIATTDDGVVHAPARGLATGLMRELITATISKPLNETLQLLAIAGAKILEAEKGVVLLTQPNGLQVATALEDEPEAVKDFLARNSEGFGYRIGSARKTLIDAMPTESDEPPMQFIGTPLIIKNEWAGALIVYPLPAEQTVDVARVTWLELFAMQGALAIEMDRLREENQHLSPQDPVSGVLKRESFTEMADREFRRSWRYNHAITAIIVDIDNMSVLNMRHGREFGNVLLRETANACRNVVRSVDLVGRYEEDAIALLLLMTGRDGARVVAERLRVGINQIRLSGAQGPVQVTATFGVCSYPRPNCASIFDLLAIAQDAQRTARRIGSNQIVYG